MKKVALSTGFIAVLLGGLWLLQGLGVVHMRPTLCFADCTPLQGPSTTWALIGAGVLAVGGAAVFWSLKRRRT
jgi:LPXTG-motif cell wall-anchored protein